MFVIDLFLVKLKFNMHNSFSELFDIPSIFQHYIAFKLTAIIFLKDTNLQEVDL